MQLSIIIVSFNVRYFLEQCLYSVLAAIANIEAEVIVVDNNSTDGSLAYLQPAFPGVQWIANNANTGFGTANNQAVAMAKGEYILFLNPDTLVPENCFQRCISFMNTHPEAGALGIKMLDGSGQYLPESKRGFPTLLTSFFKLSGLAVRFPKSETFARYHLGHLSKNENHVVDVLAGAFMLVRQNVLQQTGAFDERFFMYGEDIDLSYRLQQAGWQNWYFAESSIIHFKGESTKKGSLNYVRMFYQAMYLFVQKHYTGSNATIYRWFIKGAIGVRAGITLTVSTIKKGLLRLRRTKDNSFTDGKKILIIAAEETAKEIEAIIQSNSKAVQPILTDFLLLNTNSPKREKVKWDSSSHQHIFFGIDQYLDLETVIDEIERVSTVQFGFHYKGSRSVVSSSSKSDSGSWIAG